MSEPIRVLIADDHPLFRDGLAGLLRAAQDTELAGAATTGTEAVEMARQTQPDVVLMDLHMPELNGIEATRRIVAGSPHIAVVALTMSMTTTRSSRRCAPGRAVTCSRAPITSRSAGPCTPPPTGRQSSAAGSPPAYWPPSRTTLQRHERSSRN